MKKTKAIVYKAIIILLILASIGNIAFAFFDNTIKYAIRVNPTDDWRNRGLNKMALMDYEEARIAVSGTAVLKAPDLFHKFIWPVKSDIPDFFGCLFILFVCIHVLLIFRDFNEPDLFRDTIAKYLRRIGLAFMIFYLINVIRHYIIQFQLSEMTQYTFEIDVSVRSPYQVWVGVLLLALGLASKRIVELQREQDMTI